MSNDMPPFRGPRKSDRFAIVTKRMKEVYHPEEVLRRLEIIRHDVRNIVTAALSASEIILKSNEKKTLSPEFTAKYIKIIIGQLERIHRILESESWSAEQKLRIEEINLAQLIQDISEMHNFQDGNKVDIFIDASLNTWITGDRTRLADALTNLIINAQEAMNGTNGKLNFVGRASENTVDIILHDNGPGIPPEMRKDLFLLGVSTKNAGEEHGIGLFGAHCNIRLHGGTLQLLNSVTERELPSKPTGTTTGTTFMISLPRQQIVAEEERELA